MYMHLRTYDMHVCVSVSVGAMTTYPSVCSWDWLLSLTLNLSTCDKLRELVENVRELSTLHLFLQTLFTASRLQGCPDLGVT